MSPIHNGHIISLEGKLLESRKGNFTFKSGKKERKREVVANVQTQTHAQDLEENGESIWFRDFESCGQCRTDLGLYNRPLESVYSFI